MINGKASEQNQGISGGVVLVRVVVLLAILFGAAGTVLWVEAWVAFGMFATFCLVLYVWLKRNDPNLLQKRMEPEKNEQRPTYDLIFSIGYKLTFMIWLSSLGLDAKRFGWSAAPIWLIITGGILLSLSFVFLFLVFATNSFLAREVRVQDEDHHRVADTGPYSLVRHPMYSAIGIMFVGASLLMGSFVGVGIAILLTFMLAIRSVFEEKTLAESLDGYTDYQQKVRYRMVPLIW